MAGLLRKTAAVLAAVLFCFNLYIELAPGRVVGAAAKLGFAAAFAVLLYLAFFFGVPHTAARDKRRRDFTLLLFWYYLWMLANLLFFDSGFGRGFRFDGSFEAVNLEPLRTIRNYLSAYRYGNISLELTVMNLAGNLAAFAPMGVFLPALFRWQRSIFFFTASMTLMIWAVETVQIYTGTGSMDVDDLILNLAGALAVYLVCRVTPLWRYVCRVTKRKEKSDV